MAEKQLVEAHQRHQQAAHHGVTCGLGLGGFGFAARRHKVDKSSRKCRRKASLLALTNCFLSIGARKRTAHKPAGKGAPERNCSNKVARTKRLTKLRVTARLAKRLGTTKPSQCPVTSDAAGGWAESSTRDALLDTKSVDNPVGKL
jgi:hypothetical protein